MSFWGALLIAAFAIELVLEGKHRFWKFGLELSLLSLTQRIIPHLDFQIGVLRQAGGKRFQAGTVHIQTLKILKIAKRRGETFELVEAEI